MAVSVAQIRLVQVHVAQVRASKIRVGQVQGFGLARRSIELFDLTVTKHQDERSLFEFRHHSSCLYPVSAVRQMNISARIRPTMAKSQKRVTRREFIGAAL